ncbi:RHS repeat domain-containing protein [Peijinzhouia sedimentorum]
MFRAESTTTYMATMEPENETQEMQQFFHNLSDSRSIDARYNQTEGGRAVAYLDASRGRDYGPVWSKELAQGDSLHAAVLGMLYDPKEKPKLKDLLTGIGRQNALRSGLEGANLTGTSSLGLQPLWLALQLARQLEKAPVPESYLGYILYDQDSIRYDSGRVEISRQAFTNPEELALDITATQGGFVEVYVYNASSLPVWYDQFSISSSQAVIIQENHYYPFGMQIAGLELDLDSKNRYLYNGKELQDDHNLDWHDYGARMYDAQIGRFHTVDPLADKYWSQTPFQYTFNNPIRFVDPDGRDVIDLITGKNTPQEEALAKFVQTKAGRKFLSQFAKAGDIVGGYEFKKDGAWANHVDIIYKSSRTLGIYEGTTDTHWKLSNGRRVKLKNLTYNSVLSLANEKDFKLQFNVSLSEYFDEERSLVTIGHENFLHVEPKVNEFANIIETLFSDGFVGENGIMNLTNSLNRIGNLAEEHKIAINGESVSMESFISEVVKMTGDKSLKEIYERWKEAEKERLK